MWGHMGYLFIVSVLPIAVKEAKQYTAVDTVGSLTYFRHFDKKAMQKITISLKCTLHTLHNFAV